MSYLDKKIDLIEEYAKLFAGLPEADSDDMEDLARDLMDVAARVVKRGRIGVDDKDLFVGRCKKIIAVIPRMKPSVRDMVDVLTSMCARLYGKRAAKNRAERALKAMEKNSG